MARDSWLAFAPPLLCSLTNYLTSLLPKRPVNFATVSWQAVASLVRTAASEFSAAGSQGRVWMAGSSPSTLLENGFDSPTPVPGGAALFQGQIFVLEYLGNQCLA